MTDPDPGPRGRHRLLGRLAWAGVAVTGLVIAYATFMVAATACFAQSIVGFGASCPTTGYQRLGYATAGTLFAFGLVALIRSFRGR